MDVIYRISMVRDNCFVPREGGTELRAMMSESNFQKCAPDPSAARAADRVPPPSSYTNTCREFPRGIQIWTQIRRRAAPAMSANRGNLKISFLSGELQSIGVSDSFFSFLFVCTFKVHTCNQHVLVLVGIVVSALLLILF